MDLAEGYVWPGPGQGGAAKGRPLTQPSAPPIRRLSGAVCPSDPIPLCHAPVFFCRGGVGGWFIKRWPHLWRACR